MIACHKTVTVIKGTTYATAVCNCKTILKSPYAARVSNKAIDSVCLRSGRHIRGVAFRMVGLFKAFATLNVCENIRKIKYFPLVVEEVALPPLFGCISTVCIIYLLLV